MNKEFDMIKKLLLVLGVIVGFALALGGFLFLFCPSTNIYGVDARIVTGGGLLLFIVCLIFDAL